MPKRMLAPIEKGTVIDHLPAGKGLEVIKALGLRKEVIGLLMNVGSAKIGKKDVLKIEEKLLSPEDVKEKISKIAPEATVNLIEGSEVTRKEKLAEL